MKNATQYARKFSALLKQLGKTGKPGEPTSYDPVTQLVLGFLQWNSTTRQAQAAYERLMTEMVDNNDLRVSHPAEILRLLGERYPRAAERVERMHDALQEIFRREHGVSLDQLHKKGKKEVQQYLLSLPGMVPYAASLTTLMCFGGHGIPVDDHLAELLRSKGVVAPDATVEEITTFLEHHTKVDQAQQAHLVLQACVTKPAARGSSRSAARTGAKAKGPARSHAAKKSAGGKKK